MQALTSSDFSAPYECYSKLASIFTQMVTNPTSTESVDEPWLAFPAGGQSYDFQNDISIPAVGTGYQTVLQFQVPIGLDGVINQYACNFTGGGFIDGSGDLIWQIKANGKAVKNYDSIRTERGDPNLPREVAPIRIYSGQTIQFVVNHNSNPILANGYIICTLSGYFYPNT